MEYGMEHSAFVHEGGCRFRVWAPEKETVLLEIQGKRLPMSKDGHGYFSIEVPGVGHGERYSYQLGAATWADPASAYQPEGVYGPSAVVDHRSFKWSDNSWRGLPWTEVIIYEIHVGTFSPQGD